MFRIYDTLTGTPTSPTSPGIPRVKSAYLCAKHQVCTEKTKVPCCMTWTDRERPWLSKPFSALWNPCVFFPELSQHILIRKTNHSLSCVFDVLNHVDFSTNQKVITVSLVCLPKFFSRCLPLKNISVDSLFVFRGLRLSVASVDSIVHLEVF